MPNRGIEAKGADEIAALQRDPGKHQPGIDRMVEPGDAVDRFEHQVAGVERHDDLMIALGAKLPAHQLAVPRRMLPVDKAGVHAGRIFAQRLELGALALLHLGFDPVDRLLEHRELQGRAMHAPHIGQHVDAAVHRDAADELDKPRAAPASVSRRNRR